MNKCTIEKIKNIEQFEKKLCKYHFSCLCPNCSQKAINSHSIQRNGWLSSIAENGHVVGVKRRLAGHLYNTLENSSFNQIIDKIGLAEASTFKGYCNNHDTELFKCIEKQPLDRNNIHQVFAFHLRAVSFERIAKINLIGIMSLINLPDEVFFQKELFYADSKYRWNLFWQSNKYDYFSKNYSYKWHTIEKNIGIAAVTMISPLSKLVELWYMTEHLQRNGMYNVPRPAFSLSVIPTENETHIVMCWHNSESHFVAPWVEEFCEGNGDLLSKFLNKCIFSKSEDFYIRPSLWDSLDEETRKSVCENLSPKNNNCKIPEVIEI